MKHRWLGNQSPPSGPLFWRPLDRLDYWIMQARLWIGDAIYGPFLDGDTPVDFERRAPMRRVPQRGRRSRATE
jgi:hypothetical protein